MFSSSTRYSTLSQQVAKELEESIRHGLLRESLPGERQLAETMQVSRRTIRAATEILRERKLVRTAHGRPTRIVAVPPDRDEPGAMRVIGMLLPKPLEDLKPYTAVIDFLRSSFYQNGYRLDLHFGQSFLSRRPAAALRRLITRFPCDAWILTSASRACQSWFHTEGIITVVAGTAHDGIPLPSVDVDMFATSRHAATVLLRKGHRRIALVLEQSDWAGHRKTEEGFFQGIRQFGENATGQLLRHGGDVSGLEQVIARALQGPAPPTALFIVNPYHYLAVASILADRGMKVPQDMSLLCRDDDVCLNYLPIRPNRYASSAADNARQIFSILSRALRRGRKERSAKPILTLPVFLEGKSIAAPRPSGSMLPRPKG